MKATKKIVGAACALVAAVALSAGSTFAWFSMNTSVTATGMEVKAQAPTSLLISNTSKIAGFGSTVTLSNDVTTPNTNFSPVAYSDTVGAWYLLTNEAMAFVDENGEVSGFTEIADGQPAASFTNAKINIDGEDKDVYTTTDAVKNTYHDTVWLKVEGAENKSVKAEVSFTATPDNAIKKAIHVLFVVDGTITTVDMGDESTVTASLATLTANADGTQVDIYCFLSGNDSDCKNSNAVSVTTLSLNITFKEA